MKPRKYGTPSLMFNVYVSSSRHYTFSFHVTEYLHGQPGKRRTVTWCYEFGTEPCTLPRYLVADMQAKVKAGIKAGVFRYYEYDQDGNKRYDGLRYFDADHVAWIASRL